MSGTLIERFGQRSPLEQSIGILCYPHQANEQMAKAMLYQVPSISKGRASGSISEIGLPNAIFG